MPLHSLRRWQSSRQPTPCPKLQIIKSQLKQSGKGKNLLLLDFFLSIWYSKLIRL